MQQLVLLFLMDGTGDDGDSVNHYLHNRYAFKYPWLFIHSWAKPVFVLASCLFAQLGFIGLKIFNSLMALGAAYFAYKLAKKMNVSFPELAMPLLMFMPDYLKLSLSGLTEPLFSFMLVAALLSLAYEKKVLGSLIISFLHFTRPEGLFFIAIGIVYFLFKKGGWKYIPLLFFGHLFYTLFGVVFFEQEWNWVIATNPNAVLEPYYGVTGDWLHYVEMLIYVIGVPIYILFWLGSLAIGFSLLKNIKKLRQNLIPAFVFAGTFSVIIAHTIFWKFGLFKSFGLTRNLLTVAPLMSILALIGMNSIWKVLKLKPKATGYATMVSMLLVIAALFSGSKYTAKFPSDFKLNAAQILSEEVSDFLDENYPKMVLTFHYYPYMNVYRDQDPFDWNHHKNLFKNIIDLPIPGNTVVIWDDWFSVQEGHVTLESLHVHPELDYIKTFETVDKWKRKRTFALFKTKEWK